MILDCCDINLKNLRDKIILLFNYPALRTVELIRSNIKFKVTGIVELKFIIRINIGEIYCIDSILQISAFFICGICYLMNYVLFNTYMTFTYCANWQLNQRVLNLCR